MSQTCEFIKEGSLPCKNPAVWLARKGEQEARVCDQCRAEIESGKPYGNTKHEPLIKCGPFMDDVVEFSERVGTEFVPKSRGTEEDIINKMKAILDRARKRY